MDHVSTIAVGDPDAVAAIYRGGFKRSGGGAAAETLAGDMRKRRFTEAQIIGMLKEQEAGMATAVVCRRHGLSPGRFYKLKAKYVGMDMSDAQRLRAPEGENGKLKRLLADAMPDNIVLKALPGSKPWEAIGPRAVAEA